MPTWVGAGMCFPSVLCGWPPTFLLLAAARAGVFPDGAASDLVGGLAPTSAISQSPPAKKSRKRMRSSSLRWRPDTGKGFRSTLSTKLASLLVQWMCTSELRSHTSCSWWLAVFSPSTLIGRKPSSTQSNPAGRFRELLSTAGLSEQMFVD